MFHNARSNHRDSALGLDHRRDSPHRRSMHAYAIRNLMRTVCSVGFWLLCTLGSARDWREDGARARVCARRNMVGQASDLVFTARKRIEAASYMPLSHLSCIDKRWQPGDLAIVKMSVYAIAIQSAILRCRQPEGNWIDTWHADAKRADRTCTCERQGRDGAKHIT